MYCTVASLTVHGPQDSVKVQTVSRLTRAHIPIIPGCTYHDGTSMISLFIPTPCDTNIS
jgi:hypothetical protein